jgi:hypothetical protein
VLRNALDHFERDHFARYLGEALDPAKHHDETVAVHADHVSGVVPARSGLRLRRLQHARLVVEQVTEHDVGAAHVQPPAERYPFYWS